MKTLNLGYACINQTLRPQNVFTSRTMRKNTFETKGLSHCSGLAIQNLKDLKTILEWNERNDIRFFRMSSGLFPWASEYDLFDLPDFDYIEELLRGIGTFAKQHNHRLTFHPDHFVKLASPTEKVLLNSIRDLEVHGEIMDLMELSRTPYNKINIHVGGAYGNKKETLVRFKENMRKLPKMVFERLTVENDDRTSMFTLRELYESIGGDDGVPLVFDYHHHALNPGEETILECLVLSRWTWPTGIRPVVHYSESRRKEQDDPSIKLTAHSDFIIDKIETFDYDVDVMIEAKEKELALLRYKELHRKEEA